MGRDSKIEWTEHTFNPWHGCTKISEGCANCYAESFAKRIGYSDTGSQFPIWGNDAQRRFFGDKHWEEPLQWNTAAEKLGVMHRVFCGSMCDILELRPDRDDVASEMTWLRNRVFLLAKSTPNLLWLFLTKRAENARRLYPEAWMGSGNWPRNVMAGFTIENQKRLDARVPHIAEFNLVFPGAHIFASCEPLLSSLDWTSPEYRSLGNVNRNNWLAHLNWVVAGGESGPKARPMHPEWIRKLRDDCEGRDDMCRPWPLPFLFKQWGEWGQRGVGSRDDQPMVRLTTAGRNGQDLANSADGGDVWMQRFGKKEAGRLLDGRTWDGIPRLTYGPQIQGVKQ